MGPNRPRAPVALLALLMLLPVAAPLEAGNAASLAVSVTVVRTCVLDTARVAAVGAHGAILACAEGAGASARLAVTGAPHLAPPVPGSHPSAGRPLAPPAALVGPSTRGPVVLHVNF
jgi:hypothetical protein